MTGVRPYLQVGCIDSLGRIKPWMRKRLDYVDKWMNYSFSSIPSSYTLTITSAGWSTICVPLEFDVPDGLTFYSVIGRDENGQLVKQKEDHPKANKPYLVKGYPGDYVLIGMTEEPMETAPDYLVNHCLHGCIAESFAPVGSYVLQNHNGNTAFYQVNENGKIKIGPHRAYLVFDDGDASANPSVGLGEDGFVTSVSMEHDAPQIIGIYKMNGMRVEKMTKGVNLVKYDNGRTVKIVVK